MKETPPEQSASVRGNLKLNISEEVFYREWNPHAYAHFDSTAYVGYFPAQKIDAIAPKKCKICENFGEDALDFDLARVEDSLFPKAFPKLHRELMYPGMWVSEKDSTQLKQQMQSLLSQTFVDGRAFSDLLPWKNRLGIEQTLKRVIPMKIKLKIQELASAYHVRYLSIPIYLRVEMLPNEGRNGAYTWESLWMFWDARYGELVFLNYSRFKATTATRVAPDHFWAEPFAYRLWNMLSTDPATIENH